MRTFLQRGWMTLLLWTLVLPATAQPNETLSVDGETVTLLRDRYGVPHVFANSLRGLFFGNGYAVAQDRLGQMEFYRHDARGEMAELVGSGALAADKETRTAGYSEAERMGQFHRLSSEEQTVLQAYADGVNAWREKAVAGGKLPKRLTDLGVTPAPWRVTDTIAIGQMMARRFGGSIIAGGELRNLNFLTYLKLRSGKDAWALINELTWKNDPKAPVTLPDSESPRKSTGPAGYPEKAVNVEMFLGKTAKFDPAALEKAVAQAEMREEMALAKQYALPTKLGSYAIAVHGSKSVTGNALLVGGPQMGWQMPQIAHEIHLSGAGLDIIGMGFAGTPGVLIGHNPNVAWTFTSGVGDFTDTFVEKLNPDNLNQYWYKGAWHDMEKRVETIAVKDKDPVQVEVFRTVHGPILQWDKANKRAYAQQMSFWNKEMESLAVYVKYYRSHTVKDIIDAAAEFPTSFNTLCADQSGQIGYRYCGLAPIRADGIDPRLPTPGTGEYDWKGFVPADQMPHGLNPKQGFFCNWNNKPASWWDNGDTPVWGGIWHVSRIADLLRAKPKLTTDDLRALLMDIGTYDINAEHFVPLLLQAAKKETAKLTPDAQAAVTTLAAWDLHGQENSVAKTIFDAWFQQVREDLFLKSYGNLNPLGSDLTMFNLAMQPSFMLHALLGKKSSVPNRYDFLKGNTADGLLVGSLNKALDKLAKAHGPVMAEWRFHRGRHPIPGVGDIPDYDRGTYIQIVECAKPRVTGVNILPPGQNENPDSPHYGDQRDLAAWWFFKPMLTERPDIEKK